MEYRYFHNSVPLSGAPLAQAQVKAKTQQEIILGFFKSWPDESFTPCQVYEHLGCILRCPITSVRRSITNLEQDGKLIKTGEQRRGLYRMMNNCWKLNAVYKQTELFK